MIEATVIINQPQINKKKPSEIELMLKEDDSESSSDGSLSQSPKFGQRQYSQRGTVLKKPIDVQDSMGDIMEELDNQKQPNALQQILEAKSEESSQEIAKK